MFDRVPPSTLLFAGFVGVFVAGTWLLFGQLTNDERFGRANWLRYVRTMDHALAFLRSRYRGRRVALAQAAGIALVGLGLFLWEDELLLIVAAMIGVVPYLVIKARQ